MTEYCELSGNETNLCLDGIKDSASIQFWSLSISHFFLSSLVVD